MVQDTGGWEPDAKGLQQSVARQAEIAMKTADAIVLVVDTTVGATATDEAVAKVLRRSKTPVLLAANKVDDERLEAEAAALWSLEGSRTRSPPPTAAAPVICSTRSSKRCPKRLANRPPWVVRAELHWWASPTWARAR